MRYLPQIIALCSLLAPAWSHAGCADAVTAGDASHRYAHRMLRETTLDGARRYAKKAEDAASTAMEAADVCECDDAWAAFYRAVSHAKAATRAEDLAGVKDTVREMMRLAEEGVTAAEQCR